MTSRAQILKEIAVREFQRHWKQILQNLKKGRPTLANSHYLYFEGDTYSKKMCLAKRFYGREHAEKIASLTQNEVENNLSAAYLPAAIHHVMKEYENKREQVKEIKRVVTGEYVLIEDWDTLDIDFSKFPSAESFVGATVRTYPVHRVYDDWYEMTFAGAGYGCNVILMKSTGERFSKKEVEWVESAVFDDIEYNEDRDVNLWRCDLELLDKSMISVRIQEIEIWDYMEDIVSSMKNLNKRELIEYGEGIKEIIDRENTPRLFRGKAGARTKVIPINVGSYFRKGLGNYTKKQIQGNIERILFRKEWDNNLRKDVVRRIENKLKQIKFEAPSCFGSPSPVTVGSEIKIKGSGFGKLKGDVWAGDVSLKILDWSDREIRCVLSERLYPREATYDVGVILKNGPYLKIEDCLKTELPKIGLVMPSKGVPGDLVLIQGKYFGSKKGRVYVGNELCRVIDWKMNSITGDSRIKFVVPKRANPDRVCDIKVANVMGEHIRKGCFRVGD